MRRILLTAAGLVGLAGVPAGADDRSQPVCLPSLDLLAARLADGWAERPVAAGIGADGSLLSTFAAGSGSWTLVVTLPGGPSCVAASGHGFALEPRPLDPTT